MFRLAAALLILSAAACGDLPRPFQAAPGEAANPLVEPRESLVIRVAAVDGPPLPLARLLARSVAESLGELGIAAAARDHATSAYVLGGRAGVNLDNPDEPFIALIEWSLTDADGDGTVKVVLYQVGIMESFRCHETDVDYLDPKITLS